MYIKINKEKLSLSKKLKEQKNRRTDECNKNLYSFSRNNIMAGLYFLLLTFLQASTYLAGFNISLEPLAFPHIMMGSIYH